MLFGKRKGQKRDSLRGGGALISAVDARKAPSSLTGTACGRLRSLLARVFPFPQAPSFPQRAFSDGRWSMRRASFFGDVCWHPLFHWNTTESCVEKPGEKGGLRRLTPLSVSLMRPVHATGPVGSLFMAGASCAAMLCPSRSRASGYSVRICLP